MKDNTSPHTNVIITYGIAAFVRNCGNVRPVISIHAIFVAENGDNVIPANPIKI